MEITKEMLKNMFDSMTDEQRDKALECKSPDEFFKFAAKERIPLPDDLLDAVNGGYVVYLDPEDGYLTQGWTVVNDRTGTYVMGGYESESWAKWKAFWHGYSIKTISVDDWKQMPEGGRKWN